MNTRRLLGSLVVIGLMAGVAGYGFGAFSATTSNTGNSFAAGSVTIGDNDSGSALYNVSAQRPGVSVTSCIKVTYTGSLDADVRLYTPDTIGAIGPYVDLTITAGTQATPTFPDCTGFVADSGPALYSGTLAAWASGHNNYLTGLVDYPGTTATKWVKNDAVIYQFTVTLQDNNLAQGLSSGTHSFVWEAHNQ